MRLEIHCIQQNSHAVCILHLAIKHAAEVLEPALLDYYFITDFEILERFHKPIVSNSRSDQVYDLVFNGRRSTSESDYTMHAPGKPHSVILRVECKASEDVTGKQGSRHPSHLRREFVIPIHS